MVCKLTVHGALCTSLSSLCVQYSSVRVYSVQYTFARHCQSNSETEAESIHPNTVMYITAHQTTAQHTSLRHVERQAKRSMYHADADADANAVSQLHFIFKFETSDSNVSSCGQRALVELATHLH